MNTKKNNILSLEDQILPIEITNKNRWIIFDKKEILKEGTFEEIMSIWDRLEPGILINPTQKEIKKINKICKEFSKADTFLKIAVILGTIKMPEEK